MSENFKEIQSGKPNINENIRDPVIKENLDNEQPTRESSNEEKILLNELEALQKQIEKINNNREERIALTTIKKKGQFGKFFELWKVTPIDCKLTLLAEFIFNPNAFNQRYNEEEKYRANINRRWKK